MPPYGDPEGTIRPSGGGDIPPLQKEVKHLERFAIARFFNELRNTPPIGAVGLREYRDLLANLFPEFSDVRDGELDDFLNEYVKETMTPRTPERDWEDRPDPGNRVP